MRLFADTIWAGFANGDNQPGAGRGPDPVWEREKGCYGQQSPVEKPSYLSPLRPCTRFLSRGLDIGPWPLLMLLLLF